MRRLLLALLLMLPAQAFALSCMAPSVERSFARYDAADETYVVVHGRITLDETLLPHGLRSDVRPPKLTLVPGHLRGTSLTRKGFALPFDQEVSLEVRCLGPWCGGLRNGEDVLAFLRKDEEGYALDVNPCPGAIFTQPREEMLRAAQTCLESQTCKQE